MREINIKRQEYHALIHEMRLSDQESFYKYSRMTPARFDDLLSLLGPAITRQHTNFKTPISPGERLVVTLRFLATFGIMAVKFRVFRRLIIAYPEKVVKIIKAACGLHYYLKISDIRSTSLSARQYHPAGYVDH